MRNRAGIAVIAGVGLMLGCATTKVTDSQQYGSQLPKPQRIVVYPFAASAGQVDLDMSPTVVASWKLKGLSGLDEREDVARQVSDALADSLVEKIQKMGLPAERWTGQPVTGDVPTLAVTGHFLAIDEGNRLERVTIGLGAGRSDVRTEVLVTEVTPNGTRSVDEFEIQAQSGRKPGAAETLGAGAAAGTLATAAVVTAATAAGSEAFGADVDADAHRTAEKIAKMLQDFFADQGWVSPQ